MLKLIYILERVKKIYEVFSLGSGSYYKIKILIIYILLYLKRITGKRPCLKKEEYLSISTDGVLLPFFIKDQLDFDVLWDSMYDDQYSLEEVEQVSVKNGIKVVFDVGANIGTAALKFYQKFPDAVIYCFEPDPYNFKRLTKNISLLKQPERIKVYNYAISDMAYEKMSFFRGTNNHWSSSLIKRDCVTEEVVVDVISLDAFCKREKIDKIDILKMDIEGAESEALDGFSNGLNKVGYVIGELHPTLMSDSVSSFIARFNLFNLMYLNTDSGVFKFKRKK